ncbi:MAG: CoA-binding protein [Candidatus Diapherotrites archaeon]
MGYWGIEMRKYSRELDCFFYPEHIAIIGASSEERSIGKQLFTNFMGTKLSKKTYPVNPFHKNVLGKKAYVSVKDIPYDIDLAIIAIPAKHVPNALQDCSDKGVKGVIIISSGFKEAGNEDLTEKMKKIIRENKTMRVVGPNCFGVLMPEIGLNTTFSVKEKSHLPKHGNLSFFSQSGALGVAILDWASTQNFGIHKFMSYGNAIDVDETDILDHMGHDKGSKVVTAYIEEVKRGRKFMETAKKVSKRKPFVVLKGGSQKATHHAISSHTGSLAGDMKVYEAVFKQTGIVHAKNMRELFSFAKILENEPIANGNRTAIITNGGGYGIVTADEFTKNNLTLAKLSSGSIKKLKQILPPAAGFGNPIDMLGGAGEKEYAFATKTALNDKNVDMIAVLVLFNTPTVDQKTVKELIKIKKTAKKPLVVLTFGSGYTQHRKDEFEKGRIITYDYPDIAARSLEALAKYSAFVKR